MVDSVRQATAAVLAEADADATRVAQAAQVVVRDLATMDELAAAVALFDAIWGAGSPVMPVDLLRAMVKAGSYASGAYDPASGELLGACVGFFGPPARAELHSHVTGVSPAGRGRSVGFALKAHQRAWCLRRGTAVIAWTYDPLIRRNAYFNLVKLGARPAEYLPDFYGVLDDAINGGTETDRMLVRWDLLAGRTTAAVAGDGQAASAAAELRRGAVAVLSAGPDGQPVPGTPGPELAGRDHASEETFLVGVPPDIESLRVSDPAAATAWRTALRDALVPLLAAGARVTGFDRGGWYVLTGKGDTG
jgi:predicted GNAT superfamily acetyltransferase